MAPFRSQPRAPAYTCRSGLSIRPCAATERPPLYERSTDYIWTDDHVGREMLRFHLDPDGDLASRRHASIDAQVRWITNCTDPALRPRLLDIGCGPGLYCERFAAAGFTVTGLDFNSHSLEYAREHAATSGHMIDYRYGNYLDLDDREAYDAITLINRDLSLLERKQLLGGRSASPSRAAPALP